MGKNKLSYLLYRFDYSINKIDSLDYKTLELENNLERIVNIESIDNYRVLVSYSLTTGKKAHDTNQLEIWSTNDLNLERKSRDEEPLIRIIKYAIFNFNTNQITALEHLDNQDVNVLNQKYILYHSTNQYYDYTYSQRFTDLNLYDIENKTTSKITKQLFALRSSLSISPNRDFIVFKKAKTHYLYNTSTKSIIPIDNSYINQAKLYWSKDSQRLYFSTDNGFFVYSPINKSFKTLIDSKNKVSELKVLNPIKMNSVLLKYYQCPY